MPGALTSPGRRLLQALSPMLLLGGAVIWLAVHQPWLGLDLHPDEKNVEVRITHAHGPSAALIPPLQLHSIQHEGQGTFQLQALDVIEEPDTLPSYQAVRSFLARQQRLHRMLDGSPLLLQGIDHEGKPWQLRVQPEPTRPVTDLPAEFWIQLVAGAGGFLIGVWVMVLRPGDWGARFFALTGAGLLLSSYAAALYSSRELALSQSLFRGLSMINHFGGPLFGNSLMSLFLVFPQQLIRLRWLLLIPAIFLPWFLLDIFYLLPDPVIGMYLPIVVQTVCVLLLILVQWRKSRGAPLHLAALRWLGLSSLITCNLFTLIFAVPLILGHTPLMSQGDTFGVFLIFYGGLALGLRRYRLFELDRWAFHLLLWTGGAFALMLVDLLLVLLLDFSRPLSLALSLAICGFLWLPFRGWLWERIVGRHRLPSDEMFRRVIAVALAPNGEEYRHQWLQLLRELFSPLEIREIGAVHQPVISGDGLLLSLPAQGSVPALELSHAGHGQRLFGAYDIKQAREATEMLTFATRSRDAYNHGVNEERGRIARDLHDDIGSRLLTGLHQPELLSTRRSIQQAITEMRTIINGLTGTAMPLDDVVAELRHETALRLESAAIAMDWPVEDDNTLGVTVGYRIYRNYLAVMREVISNILRHAKATRVRVETQLDQGMFLTVIEDDGIGMGEAQAGGHGLANLRRRSEELGGTISFDGEARGTRIRLRLPVA